MVDQRLIQAIRQQPQELQLPLLTTALIESGGVTNRLGDGGHSGGAYQENDWGRGHGIPMAQRFDPVASTARAAREFQQYYGKGARGAELAYDAQRPADKASYIQKYNANIERARKLLGMPAQPLGSTTRPGVQRQQSMTQAGLNTDPRMFLAQAITSRSKGESLSQAITRGAMAARTAPQAGDAAATAAKLAGSGAPAAPTTEAATGPVAAAKKYLGTPYVWGAGNAEGPTTAVGHGTKPLTGFDCSSLVMYAWAKNGVSIPRTTYDQIKALPAISTDPKSWREGDLIYPNEGHVQMYIGNGKAIEAPQTGGVVQIVDARPAKFARRPGA